MRSFVRNHKKFAALTALCIVSKSLVGYVDSYNRVSSEATSRKFGHDVFQECAEEARKNWERTASMSAKE